MEYLYIFIMGLVVGAGVVWFLVKNKKSKNVSGITEFSRQQTEKKEESKKKIMELLERKSKIVNDDVQGLLGVSDATATRYLDELEKQGKVKQVGETGGFVYYIKV